MAEAVPERITDLLKDDDYLYDEEDTAADMDADKPETPRAPPAQAAAQQLQQGQGQAAAGKRVPIPVPGKRMGSGEPAAAAQLVNGTGEQQRSKGPASLPPPEASRYFIIKSNSEYNIKLSVQTGVWSTKRHNEMRLNDAFRSGANVMLIFSYAGGGQFDGYAQMTSLAEGFRMATWEGGMTMGGTFDLEWRRAYGLRWEEVAHLRNPLNEDKPVKISRDGQELPPELGHTLLVLIEEGADQEGVARPPLPVKPAQTTQRNGGFQGASGPRRPPFGGGRGFTGRDGPGPRGMQGPMGMGPMGPFMMPGPFMGMGMPGMGMPGMGMMDPSMMGMMGMRNGPMGPRPPPPRPPSGPPPPGGRGGGLAMGMAGGAPGRGGREEPQASGTDAQIRLMEQQLASMQRMLDERLHSERGGRRHRRSRSRSRSPRWSRRSPSRSRSPRRRDLSSMSYDEYLDDFNRSSRGGRGGRDVDQMSTMVADMTRMLSQQRSAARAGPSFPGPAGPALGAGMRGGLADAPRSGRAGGGGQGMGGDPDPASMTEAEYVRMWEDYSRESGEPFDAQQVRGWYRSFQASRGR